MGSFSFRAESLNYFTIFQEVCQVVDERLLEFRAEELSVHIREALQEVSGEVGEELPYRCSCVLFSRHGGPLCDGTGDLSSQAVADAQCNVRLLPLNAFHELLVGELGLGVSDTLDFPEGLVSELRDWVHRTVFLLGIGIERFEESLPAIVAHFGYLEVWNFLCTVS